MEIIIPPRKRLQPDPFISPVPGEWGPCALCRTYSKLTEAHIPPRAAGNTDNWVGRSYLTKIGAGNEDLYFGRHFKGGFRFKTLCQECNSSLGGREDQALADFFERVRKIIESPVLLGTPIVGVTAKPNLLLRGMFAHLASANDDGRPCPFDAEAREIFFKKRELHQSSWNLFYWLYLGKKLVVTRNIFHATWSPKVDVRPMFFLKLYPLAFLFLQESWFMGLPNVRKFLRQKDDDEVDLPLQVFRYDVNPYWPATTSDSNIIMLGGNHFGLVGERG